MDLQSVLVALLNNIFLPLLKFAVLCIFVTAIIQVIKGISAVGFLKIFRDVLGILWRSKGKDGKPREVDEETWKTLNFIIALVGVKLLNFTLLASFLGKDLDTLSPGASWFDYVGTAALVYMGADWTFNNFTLFAEAGKKLKDVFASTNKETTEKTTEKTSKETTSEQPAK